MMNLGISKRHQCWMLVILGLAVSGSAQTRTTPAITSRLDLDKGRFSRQPPRSRASVRMAAPLAPFVPLFVEAPEYPAGHLPFSVATADFNGDGKTDLAVVDGCLDPACDQFAPHQSAVDIQLGNGNGTFQAPQQFLAGVNAQAITVGDFNHDGHQDLAVTDLCMDLQCTDPNSTISILLGNGDGTFQVPFAFATGSLAFAVSAADLNGDGNLDLATSDFAQASVSVLLGNGDGTFRPKVDYTTDDTPIAVVIADFNADGKLDLVTANYSPSDATGNLSILLGNGDGTFQPRQDFFSVLGNPSTVAAADLNGDGKLDLVTTTVSCNVADSIVVIFGNGDGTFNLGGHVYFSGVSCGFGQVLVTDFNGDGKVDIASLNPYGNAVSVFPGVGDGTFPTHIAWGTGIFPLAIAADDFNGDGKMDLVSVNDGDDTATALLGNGDATFQARRDFDTFDDPFQVTAADFNGDGKVDLITANGIYPTMSILIGNADGTFQPHIDLNLAGAFGVADLNQDGKDDLAVLTTSQTFSVFIGLGNGSFRPQVDYAVPANAFGLAIADFNGDGKSDAIVSYLGDMPAGLRIFVGQGDGTLTATSDVSLPAPGALFAADFNQDGKADVLVCQDGELDLLAGNGDATFQPPLVETNAGGVCPSAIGDVNRDGTPDLLIASANGISVLLGNADGTFQPPIESNLGGPATPDAAGDLDGDGKIDVAVSQNNTIVVLQGNGDGTFQIQGAYPVSSLAGAAIMVDVNADGKLDIASPNGSAYTLGVLLNIANIPMFTLSANFVGAGSGTVIINPGGVSCTSNCSKSYATGTSASMSASPQAGSVFSGWSGGGCSGTASCSLALTSDQTVTATFDLIPDFSLAVSSLSPGTVNAGQAATATIDIAAIAGFSTAVDLSCIVYAAAPSAPGCSITPNSATPGMQATLTVTTSGPASARLLPSGGIHRWPLYALFIPVGAVLLGGMGPGTRRTKRVLASLLACAIGGTLIFLVACGGGSSQPSGTPPGLYSITVRGTSGATSHSATVKLTVQ